MRNIKVLILNGKEMWWKFKPKITKWVNGDDKDDIVKEQYSETPGNEDKIRSLSAMQLPHLSSRVSQV